MIVSNKEHDHESGFFEDNNLPDEKHKRMINHYTNKALLRDEDKLDLTDFDVLKVLGTGAYGKVYLVRKRNGPDNGKLYAMKVLRKAALVQKKKSAEHTKTEREILEKIRNRPFLVTMHYAFQTDSNLHIILDYVSGGELFTHLYQRENFKENEVRIFIAELILALEQLHKLNIIYRDVKLENILIDSDGHVVLTDFGLSKELSGIARTHSFCGTIEYMAPEVVRNGDVGHDFAVDWWSVGVLTYELLTGSSPFTFEGNQNSQQEITNRILHSQPPVPKGVGRDIQDFIAKLLVKDPKKRLGGNSPNADQIKSHRFFQNLDWKKLAKKGIPAPLKPKLKDAYDTSNFSTEFTSQPAVVSPSPAPTNHERLFRGYSFVAPNLMPPDLEDDVVPGLDNSLILRPNPLKVLNRRPKQSPFFVKYMIESPETIGVGTYSICMKCRNRETMEVFAVKIVSSDCDVTDEIATLKRCQGPFVVALIEVMTDSAYTFIVMELLDGGDLLQRMERSELTHRDSAMVFGQIVRALQHMHENNIVHRDLRLKNIRFVNNDDADVRIIDFGLAQNLNNVNAKSCCTLDYAATEVVNLCNGQTYTKACDIWSIGVLTYTMMCGHSPFGNGLANLTYTQSKHVIVDRIRRGSFDFDSAKWLKITEPTKEMIRGLLQINPSKRSTLEYIIEKNYHNLIKNEKSIFQPARTLRCDVNMVFEAQRETFRCCMNGFSQLEQCLKKSTSTISIASSRHSSSNGGVLSPSSGHASFDQNNRSRSRTASISSDTTEVFCKFDKTQNNLDYVKQISDNGPQPVVSMEVEEDFHGFSTDDRNGVREYVQKFKYNLQRMNANKKAKQAPISPDKKRRSNIQVRHDYCKVAPSPKPCATVTYTVKHLNNQAGNKRRTVDPVDPYFQRSVANGYVYGNYFNTSELPAKRNRTNVNYKEIDDDEDFKKRKIRAFMKQSNSSWII
ncbi:Ribosomal protein S6 kinase alpha-5 [Pseudolycoriella hygida]|uniref:non-specific serine/threonine protein kinase n=1 Tax=Pseudolycoriella hygida TaxID=35572 RepID=A0A9Q0N4H5_9DIPT|nr:Ribosomal protein S6 kinase alpha-5 [Pseudolycoriella hygida]